MNTKAKQSDFPPILQCIYLLKYCIKQLYQTDKRAKSLQEKHWGLIHIQLASLNIGANQSLLKQKKSVENYISN